MSRATRTSIILAMAAVAVCAVISYRSGLIPNSVPLHEELFILAFTTAILLGMAFLFGATSAGIAALWASWRKKQPNLLAAFNLGVIVFLVVQVLGQVAFENYKSKMAEHAAAPHAPL